MRPPPPSSARRAHPALTSTHALLIPDGFDSSRDHNSLVLASRRRFRAASAWDAAPHVIASVRGAFLQPGDLYTCIIYVEGDLTAAVDGTAGRRWLLAPFHGHSHGSSARPVLPGLNACWGERGDVTPT